MKTALSALVVVVVAGLSGVTACGGSEKPATEPTVEVGCIPETLQIVPNIATLHPGDSLHVLAIYSPCLGLPRTVVMQWQSSRPSVATVEPLEGVVRAYTRGTATIIASDPHDSNVKGAMALVVE